jgi:hypothetical protein
MDLRQVGFLHILARAVLSWVVEIFVTHHR